MKYIYGFLIRALLCLVPVSVFSFILTPITIYGSYLLLSFVFGVEIFSNLMIVNGYVFSFVEACIASMAYYLIWLLVLLTKGLKLRKRISMVLFGFGLILFMNLIRVLILVILKLYVGVDAFESVHFIFWALISGVYVAIVWIIIVSLYKIKSVPVYSDLKYLFKKSLFKK